MGRPVKRLWHIVFWPLLAVTLAVYLAMALWSLPIIAQDADGLRAFDMRPFGYTLPEARAFLSALGDTGLAQYTGAQKQLDAWYPALMATTLVLAYWRLFGRRAAMAFSVVAILGAVFDYQENIAVADLLGLGADRVDEEVVSIAALFTMLKSAAVTVAILALVAGLVLAWQRRAS